MSVTIDGVFCGTKPIVRGSPQGSALGCLLYCINTQNLAEREAIWARANLPPSSTPPNAANSSTPVVFEGSLSTPTARRGSRFFPGSGSEDSNDINFWDSPKTQRTSSSGSWEAVVGVDGVITFKYVINTTAFESVPMSTAIKHFTTGTPTETIHPAGLGETLSLVAENAEGIGMQVNLAKTQLLCISPNTGCITSAAIQLDGNTIQSSSTMKLVGFTFGSSPIVEAHMTSIREEYRVKVWILFHLREAGIKGLNLYRRYCCYLRSRIDYLWAAYHSMLVKGKAAALERLHRYSLRLCFGFDGNIGVRMDELDIETLGERRLRTPS